jgi:hypothetical protein
MRTKALQIYVEERIHGFKKGYQPRSDLVKNENGDLLVNSCSILNRWKNYVSVIEFTWGQ